MRIIFRKFIFIFPLILVFSSCLGLSMDIHLKQDGSGRITMEYRIPSAIQNLGRLDGNENQPAVPLSRRDFERSISRIPGLRIASFSSRERNDEYITSVSLDFDNISALSGFLNTPINGSSLNLILSKPGDADINSDLLYLLNQTEYYKTDISFTADGRNSSLSVTDGSGSPITSPSSSQVVTSGRKVSFSINTVDIFNQDSGLGLNINWQE